MLLNDLAVDTVHVSQLAIDGPMPRSWLHARRALILNIAASGANADRDWREARHSWASNGTPVGWYISGDVSDNDPRAPRMGVYTQEMECAWYELSKVQWHGAPDRSSRNRCKPNRNVEESADRIAELIGFHMLLDVTSAPIKERFIYRDNLEPTHAGGKDLIEPTVMEVLRLCRAWNCSAFINVSGYLSDWKQHDVDVLEKAQGELEGRFIGLTVEHAYEYLTHPRYCKAERNRWALLSEYGIPLVMIPRPSSTTDDRNSAVKLAVSLRSGAPIYTANPPWQKGLIDEGLDGKATFGDVGK